MKKKNYLIKLGIAITCCVFLLAAGCSNQNEQNTPPEPSAGSNDKPKETAKEFIYAAEIKNAGEKLTLLDQANVDMNQDGKEASIELYTAAEKDPKGRIAWDDGQRWLLKVVDGNAEYVLFDDYVQLGNLNYWVYTAEPKAVHITILQSSSAGYIVTDYTFDSKNKRFDKNIVFNPQNVNMMHQSSY